MLRRHQQLTFAGSVHFITVVTEKRGNWFCSDDICISLLYLFESYRAKFQLVCFGYVLMPDHLHTLLMQPEDGPQVQQFMNEFKKWSSRKLKPASFDSARLWRRSYDDVPVPGRNASVIKLNYLHNNPVRRGLVSNMEDYRWSSFHDYIDGPHGIVTVQHV